MLVPRGPFTANFEFSQDDSTITTSIALGFATHLTGRQYSHSCKPVAARRSPVMECSVARGSIEGLPVQSPDIGLTQPAVVSSSAMFSTSRTSSSVIVLQAFEPSTLHSPRVAVEQSRDL